MRRATASLTSRLVVVAVALVASVSIILAVSLTLVLHSYLVGQLDDKVHAALEGATRAEIGEGGGLPPVPPSTFDPDGDGDFRGQQVGTLTARWRTGVTPTGQVLQSVRGKAPFDRLSTEQLSELHEVPADGRPHTVDVAGHGSYRVIALTSRAGDNELLVGLPTSDVDHVIDSLLGWEAVLVLLGTALAGAAALVVVRRQLRPLREVAATAHTVAGLPLAEGEIELRERVPEHLTDERTEVGQVGAALNTLLEHVESSLDARHRSEQQVRQFVADASHELRTPLATIAGYTELARRRPGDAEATQTALGKVEEEASRMTALVEDLLLLARLDAGRPLQQEPVDLSRLLIEAVSDARVVAPDHTWRLDLPEDSVEVIGDEARLHQVVTNLLTNARKYTPAGTTVTVRADARGFAVHDDGPGFAPEVAPQAFERFARGDASRTRGPDGGAGLGLSLVKAITTAHGGRVSLRSVPGDTTIRVDLLSA